MSWWDDNTPGGGEVEPWRRAINPLTNQPFSGQEEYDQVLQQMGRDQTFEPVTGDLPNPPTGPGAATPPWEASAPGPMIDDPGPGPGGPPFGSTPDPFVSTPWGNGPYRPQDLPDWFTKPNQFRGPTMGEVQNEAGYKFGLEQGLGGVESRASARGSLLSGGTKKALTRYAEDYATTKFDNAFNRSLNVFGANEQARQRAGSGLLAQESNRLGAYNTNFNVFQGENTRRLSDYLTNTTIRRNAELDYWNRLRDVSGSGQTSANV